MTTGTLPLETGPESASTSSLRSQLIQSLSTGKEYRHAFLEETIRTRIAAQIKVMRDQAQWDLKTLAERLHKKTSWSYRLEDPNLPPPTIPTLLQVAKVFDVGLDVRLVPFSEVVDDVTTLEPTWFEVVGFEEDAGLIERKGPGAAAAPIQTGPDRHRKVVGIDTARSFAPQLSAEGSGGSYRGGIVGS